MHVAASVLAAAGCAVTFVGLLGLRQRLPRNRFAGVRTAATLHDEDTFRVANRVAGLPTLVAGLVGVLAGIAGFAMPVTVVIVGALGMVAITLGAGVLGHRAALAMPQATRAVPPGCDGCACGNCPLVGADVSRMRGEQG